jgi:PKD repeat protein
MANIGVGSGAPATSAAYLTTAPGPMGPIAENDSRELRVEVRDRYNNPIGSETVNLTIVDFPDGSRPGTLAPGDEQPKSVTVTTDEQGRASVTYRAPPDVDADAGPVPVTIGANRTAVINVSEPLPANSPNTVRFDFAVTNTDGSKAAHEIEWNRTALAARSGVDCGPAGCTYDRSAGTIDTSVFTSPATPNVPFDVTSTDRTVATVSARTDRTGPNGTAAGRIDVLGPGTVDLTVSSADSSDTLSLTTRNREPSASVELSPETPRSGELVSFDAEASDPDGSNGSLEYEWAFGDGSRGFGPTPQHAYDEAGTYDVGLTVTDAYGAETTVNRAITVSNRAPEAAIEYGPTAPLTGRTVTFDASDSVDPDGSDDALAYEWDLDSDGSFEVEGERATRQYADDGDREVTLRVTDEGGATVTTTATVSVRNRQPIAEFGYGGDRTRGEPIGFDASGSSDRDGSIASYEWDLGDGTTATGVLPSHTYEEAGTYTVILEVTDDDGTTATKRRTATVDGREPTATNRPPTAAFEITPPAPGTGDPIEFDASSSSDPDGTIERYEWTLSNRAGSTAETTGETVTFEPLPPGEYRMTLTVTDGNATATTTRTFTVTSG